MEIFKQYLKDKARVTDAQFRQLEKLLGEKKIEKADFLLRQGEVCDKVFFVEKGLLRAYKVDDEGKEHINQFAPENWFITDRSSILFNHPSEYFIDALEDSELIVFENEFLIEASNISTSFREYNKNLLHNHIRQLQKRIDSLLGLPAEKRYLDFVDTYFNLTLRVPQWMIASYLGISPESLSRVRKKLAAKSQP
ncbi:MAG TPA: Crp/Fnr family transcriptional regulator [Ferruginibacter sp.]|nr:Crp/Fnr family transcriptional regulator [Ferruginibacter sp.]